MYPKLPCQGRLNYNSEVAYTRACFSDIDQFLCISNYGKLSPTSSRNGSDGGVSRLAKLIPYMHAHPSSSCPCRILGVLMVFIKLSNYKDLQTL